MYLFGAFGGIVGGGCAAFALVIWKKQIHYNRKLEVIEVALKVQFLANSYVRKISKIDDFCRYAVDPSITEIKYHIGMFNEAQGKDAYSGDGEHRFRFYREHLNSTHWVHDIFNLSVHDGQF
jgi:hypothetical protein